MTAFDDALAPFPNATAEFAADPQAARWARDCAWVPGTGYCRNRPCSPACPFLPQRAAERRHLLRWRRKRRASNRVFPAGWFRPASA